MITAGFVVLMGLSALAAGVGLLSRSDVAPPPMPVMIALVIGISLAVGLSPWGRVLAMETPLLSLIAIQSFRLPLELVMHHAVNRSIMPNQLSFSGYNFDIVTGLGAIILSILMTLKTKVPSKVVWVWNIWGMLCLLAIVIIAIATSPSVRAFGNDPANINSWVLFFPYVWLPAVLVTIAISGHIIITRKLIDQST